MLFRSLFSNIDNNLGGEFTCLEKLTETIQNKAYKIDEGIRTAASIADLNGDAKPDIIVGNWAGGVAFFKGCEPAENQVTIKQIDDISIYPNPTDGELRITNYELRITDVEVFDIYGRKLSQISNLKSQISNLIDVSHLSSGIYIVKINTDKGEVMKKVVKTSTK